MDSSDQDDFDRARFATILHNLKRDKIPSLASAVRYSGHPSTGIIDVPTTPQPVSCRLLSHITCGSYNAVFTILFDDGTLWVLKVPAHGHAQCWDAPAAEALTSEAYTMRLIRRETTLPIPEVLAFDASLENELGCPFILMELIYGKSLAEVWFDQEISQAKREQIRIRSLQGIAEAMAQLNSLTFSQGGSLVFDAKGNVADVGSSNVVDLEKSCDNMRSKDYDNTMAFHQTGPFEDPKSYLLALLDAREGKQEPSIIRQGAYKLLRLFIEWSLLDAGGQEKQFVLAHADLDNQNILVKDDGSLAGIIDWDWTAAVPHCIGPQSLPKFLLQDYDPGNYAYDVEAGEPKEGFLADSPAELACYRAMYAQFMESYLSGNDREAADVTRRSLITNTLYFAVQAPTEMRGLMIHLFQELEELTA
ncbi:kinase-like domain-containing protein, partial [Usnea florida]